MRPDFVDLVLMRAAEFALVVIVVRNLPAILLALADLLRALAFGINAGRAAAIATFQTLRTWNSEDRRAQDGVRRWLKDAEESRPRSIEKR